MGEAQNVKEDDNMKKYFEACKTLDMLKAAYRKAALENHPDAGGSKEAMQEINAEYEEAFNRLKAQQNAAAASDPTGSVKATTEAPEDFMAIIAALLQLDGLEVELCGRWLWIGGETKKHKEALKAAGCRWCAKKGLWSWHFAEDGVKWRRRGGTSMADIRTKYGSSRYKSGADADGLPA